LPAVALVSRVIDECMAKSSSIKQGSDLSVHAKKEDLIIKVAERSTKVYREKLATKV